MVRPASTVTAMNKPENILILFGSPNKRGYTAKLTDLFVEQYVSSLHNAYTLETLYAYDHHYLPCRGCGQCDRSGVCVFNEKDGFGQLFDQLRAADTLIVATPVYFLSFPAPLKTIIDRAQQLFGVKFGQGGGRNQKLHRGCLVSTCGSDDPSSFHCLERATKMFFDCLDIGFVDRLYARNTDHPENIKITDQ